MDIIAVILLTSVTFIAYVDMPGISPRVKKYGREILPYVIAFTIGTIAANIT